MAVFRNWSIENYQWAGFIDGVEVRKCPVLIISDPPPGCLSLYRRQNIGTNKWHCYNAACSVTMTVPVGGGHPRYTSALRAGETHFDRHVPLCHEKAADQMLVIEAERRVEALARACGVARALQQPKPSWVNWLREGHDFIMYPQPAFKTVQTRFGPLVKEEERVMLDTIPRPGSPLPAYVRNWARHGWYDPPRNAAGAEPVVVEEAEDMEASDSDSAGLPLGSDEAETSGASEATSGGAEVEAEAELVEVEEVEGMEASDSDSAGSYAGSDEAEMTGASEAASSGAEAEAEAELVDVEAVDGTEASDSDSAGLPLGSDEAELPDAAEAASSGAEAGGVAFVYGPDDTPASPPEADKGPIIPGAPVPLGEDSDSSSGRSVASGDLDVSD